MLKEKLEYEIKNSKVISDYREYSDNIYIADLIGIDITIIFIYNVPAKHKQPKLIGLNYVWGTGDMADVKSYLTPDERFDVSGDFNINNVLKGVINAAYANDLPAHLLKSQSEENNDLAKASFIADIIKAINKALDEFEVKQINSESLDNQENLIVSSIAQLNYNVEEDDLLKITFEERLRHYRDEVLPKLEGYNLVPDYVRNNFSSEEEYDKAMLEGHIHHALVDAFEKKEYEIILMALRSHAKELDKAMEMESLSSSVKMMCDQEKRSIEQLITKIQQYA